MKIASVVMCFDRPQYIKPVIESFEQAKESQKLDWYFFQDGAVSEVSGRRYAEDGNLEDVKKIIDSSSLPIKALIKRDYNVGPGQQRQLIYKLLEEYDLMFVFDDDMIIGEDYLRLLKIMAKQFPEYVGLLYTNTRASPTPKSLSTVHRMDIARLWGHYMWRDNWLKFKDDHKFYSDYIKPYDFHMIRGLLKKEEIERHVRVPSFSDDTIINLLCRKNRIQKLVPRVTRARYIGKEGIIAYKTERYWKRKGMHRQPSVITHTSDKYLKQFKRKG